MKHSRISCELSDKIRPDLDPWSSCTNYVGGEVLDDRLPPHTRCEWCDDDEVVRLVDVLDADGCRHTVPVGVGEEEPSVRAWAEKKGIPLDSLRNDDADLPVPTWRAGIGGDDAAQ